MKGRVQGGISWRADDGHGDVTSRYPTAIKDHLLSVWVTDSMRVISRELLRLCVIEGVVQRRGNDLLAEGQGDLESWQLKVEMGNVSSVKGGRCSYPGRKW